MVRGQWVNLTSGVAMYSGVTLEICYSKLMDYFTISESFKQMF